MMGRITTSEEGVKAIRTSMAKGRPAIAAFALELLKKFPEWSDGIVPSGQIAVDFVTRTPTAGALALVTLMEIDAILSAKIDLNTPDSGEKDVPEERR